MLLAHVGQRLDRIQAPVSVVPAVATTAIGVRAGGAILSDRRLDRLGNETPVGVDRERPHVARSDSEKLRGALDRVVRLLRAVDRGEMPRGRCVGNRGCALARRASAVMFDTVPPLVKAPAPAGKPRNSATQRIA